MIRIATEFHNSVLNCNFVVVSRIYESLSGFRKAIKRETGGRAVDKTAGIAFYREGVFNIMIHGKFLGAGLYAHEALHVSCDVYRMFSGNNVITFAPSKALANTDLFDFKAYIEHPEEWIADVLEQIVKDFWNKWHESVEKK